MDYQMSIEKLISIAIPIYNGDKYIEETLRGIFSQDGYSSEEVEILISDNASTDHTKSIVFSLQQEYPGAIKYFLNETNVGYDRNIDLLFKRSSAKFVHIHGDDDYYTKRTALKEIIGQLKNNELSVILLSAIFYNISNSSASVNVISDRDVFCETGDDFFRISKWSTAAVSSVIIKKALWNKQDLRCYIDTQWIHVGALVKILAAPSKSLIISEPLITIRTGNPRWEKNFGNQYKTGLIHLRVMKDLLVNNYLDKTYLFYQNSRFENNLRDIVYIGPKDYPKRIEALVISFPFFWNRVTFWIIQVPAMLLPSIFFKFIKIFLKSRSSR